MPVKCRKYRKNGEWCVYDGLMLVMEKAGYPEYNELDNEVPEGDQYLGDVNPSEGTVDGKEIIAIRISDYLGKEVEAVEETESEQETEKVVDKANAEEIVCTYEEIEPVILVAVKEDRAYYDPNFIAANEPERPTYLMEGGECVEGAEYTFDKKTVYEGIEYYSCVFGDGFRMIIATSNF